MFKCARCDKVINSDDGEQSIEVTGSNGYKGYRHAPRCPGQLQLSGFLQYANLNLNSFTFESPNNSQDTSYDSLITTSSSSSNSSSSSGSSSSSNHQALRTVTKGSISANLHDSMTLAGIGEQPKVKKSKLSV